MANLIQKYIISKPAFPDILITCETSVLQENTFYYIKAGSEKATCVSVTIYPDHYIEYKKDKSNMASMSWVEYKKTCAINEDLKKSSGTRHLLYSILQFIRDKFERIRIIELDDGSYFMCNDPFGSESSRKVMLVQYNIALYDMSWYQMVTKAYIMPESLQTVYNIGIQLFKDPSVKLSWDIFSRKYRILDVDSMIKETYIKTNTYREFLIELRKEEDKYCWYISSWIAQFVTDILGNIPLTKWHIDISNLPIYEMSIIITTPLIGGYRYTRRNKKQKSKVLPNGFNQTEFDLAYKDGFPYD